jgi:hypothetical protein
MGSSPVCAKQKKYKIGDFCSSEIRIKSKERLAHDQVVSFTHIRVKKQLLKGMWFLFIRLL